MSYDRNNVNQYTSTSDPAKSLAYDADGNLTNETSPGTEADAGTDFPVFGAYGYEYDPIGNRVNSSVDAQNPMVYARNEVNQYTGTTGAVSESFTYDEDGNLTGDARYRYVWDGENRLIRIEPVTMPAVNDKKLEFRYDYMNRRVEKVYSVYTMAGWAEFTRQRFVYDGWNVVLVLDGGNNAQQKLTWGLDLSGLSGQSPEWERGVGTLSGLHNAGGIGGLLAVTETVGPHQGSYWFLYDGNGNIGQVLNATNPASITVAARYVYGPYGHPISALGTYAHANPFRFSTKWLDSELAGWDVNGAVGHSGMYYYGERYYAPRLGRWTNRDPIEELGGEALYQFNGNQPSTMVDGIGTMAIILPGPEPLPPSIVAPGQPYGLMPPACEKDCKCCTCGEANAAILLVGYHTALQCWSLARDAGKEAAQRFPGELVRRDAFRHCYGQCIAALALGPGNAQKCGDAHEYCGENDPGNEAMDQHNNNLGRSFAGKPGATPRTCARDCLRAVVRGFCPENEESRKGVAQVCAGGIPPANPSFPGCGPGPGGGSNGVGPVVRPAD